MLLAVLIVVVSSVVGIVISTLTGSLPLHPRVLAPVFVAMVCFGSAVVLFCNTLAALALHLGAPFGPWLTGAWTLATVLGVAAAARTLSGLQKLMH